MDTESQQFEADNLLVDRVYTARVLAAWHFLRRARSLPLRQRCAQRLSDYPPNLLPIDDSKKGRHPHNLSQSRCRTWGLHPPDCALKTVRVRLAKNARLIARHVAYLGIADKCVRLERQSDESNTARIQQSPLASIEQNLGKSGKKSRLASWSLANNHHACGSGLGLAMKKGPKALLRLFFSV